MDELTATAQAIGAVNTIYFRENKLIGDNTDAHGFLSDLKKFVNKETRKQGNKNALVFGAGGSARAVLYALVNDGWRITIFARRIEQAEGLANSFPNYQLPITDFDDFRLSTFDLLVNTTPIGMIPDIDQSPLPENLSLPSNAFVYDLVYNPRETKLVRDARSQGLQATTGLGMLIEQAALAFEKWTGANADRTAMQKAIA